MLDLALFSKNPTLFGHDTTPRLVAVEFKEPNQVTVYHRLEGGGTSISHETFSPFLWTAEPSQNSRPLTGSLTLGHLEQFESWAAFQKQRTTLRNQDVPHFGLSDPVQQYLTITGKTLFKEMTFSQLRRLQLSIQAACPPESELPDPARDALLAITLADHAGWEECLLIDPNNLESERAALEQLNTIIEERDPDCIEGYNLFKVDLPFLVARAKRYKMNLAWGRDRSRITARTSRIQIAERTIQFTRFQVHGRHLIDTFFLIQHYDITTRTLESFQLHEVANHLSVHEKERILLDPSTVYNTHQNEQGHFRRYTLQNVREIRALGTVLCQSYFIQTQIFPYNFQDVILRGNATKIDAIFLREYLRQKHSIPDLPEPTRFAGGYTAIFLTGVVTNVWHCDIASLYPSLILTEHLLPTEDALQIFETLLKDLRHFRLTAKTQMREAVDEKQRLHLDALQSTFKILINSFYGYLGFAQAHFADFAKAAAVTARGRELLQTMVDWLHAQGAKVIEIDTDGIYFHPPSQASMADLETKMRGILPEGIEVEFDQSFPAMFSYKAKNYALLESDGSITLKGAALKSRGLEPYQRTFLEEMIHLLLTNKGGSIPSLYQKYAVAIREHQWPITLLAKTETLQDSPASYQKKIQASSRNRSAAFELALQSKRTYQAGDSICYYITGAKKKVIAYENAKLVSEWNPAERDENTAYYLGKLEELYRKFEPFFASQQMLF